MFVVACLRCVVVCAFDCYCFGFYVCVFFAFVIDVCSVMLSPGCFSVSELIVL